MQGSTPPHEKVMDWTGGILEASPDAILVVDGEGLTVFANRAAASFFETSVEALVGASAPVATDVDYVPVIEHTGLHPATGELRVTRAAHDGQTFAIATIRDITLRVRAQRILGNGSDVLRTLPDVARLLTTQFADVCLIDLVGQDGVMRIMHGAGIEAGAAVAVELHETQSAALHTDTDVVQRVSAELAASLGIALPATAVALMLPLALRDEKLGMLTLIRKERTFAAAERACAQDVGSAITSAVEKSRLHNLVSEANQSKANFLAIMSHELRTPLNAIIGYGDLLLMGVPEPVPAPAHDQVGRMRASAIQLLHIVEEILAFARMEAGREDVHAASTTVGDVIDDVRATIGPLAAAKKLDLVIEVDADERLTTDLDKLRQILTHLMSNAVKFTQSGYVRVSTEIQGDVILFHVHDTGRGVSNGDIERIFQPFWQAESAQTRREGGTGLGLTVARRLARLLGGDIFVANNPGGGSLFTLRVPRQLKAPAA